MVEIPLTSAEFAAKATQLAQSQGITLDGHEGKISKSGVTAGYVYEAGVLKISILEKPFFVSTEYCEEQIRNWLAGQS